MSQVPTPPASRQGSEAPEAELKPAGASSELLQSLDTLLEQYLHLLDRQQRLQSGLAKRLSSGFLALAHANYTCPPGRRYGADYYDERMKAIRKMSIQAGQGGDQDELEPAEDSPVEADNTNAPNFKYNFCLRTPPRHPPEEKVDAKEATQELSSEPSPNPESSQKDTTPASDENDPLASTDGASASRTFKSPLKKFRSDDPIHWYGILVPPSLRTAQNSFTEAVQGSVPELAGTVVEMRELEERITQVRAEIGSQPAEEASSK